MLPSEVRSLQSAMQLTSHLEQELVLFKQLQILLPPLHVVVLAVLGVVPVVTAFSSVGQASLDWHLPPPLAGPESEHPDWSAT